VKYDDFGEWMKAAQVTFPKLKPWMKTQPEAGRGLWKVWRTAMEDISFDAAMTALDVMVADSSKQVFGDRWDTLPGIVIKLCAGQKVQPKGERKCICAGTGIVLVGIKYQAVTFDGHPLRVIQIEGQDHCGPIGAACLCAMGEWVNTCRERKFDTNTGPKLLPKYDPKRMTVCAGSDTIFGPVLAEQERAMMAQAMMDFDGIRMDADGLGLDFGP